MSIKVINARRSPITRADLLYWADHCCPWPIDRIKYDYCNDAYLVRTLNGTWLYAGDTKLINEMISNERYAERMATT